MVEGLFVEVILVVFTQDLDLAPKVVVWALYQLKLTNLPVPVEILSLRLLPTLIITIDNFPEASLVMSL